MSASIQGFLVTNLDFLSEWISDDRCIACETCKEDNWSWVIIGTIYVHCTIHFMIFNVT